MDRNGASRKIRCIGKGTAKLFCARNARSRTNFFVRRGPDLPLDKIQGVLRIYVEGLTGKEVEVAPLSAMPQESRIGDGKTIYLPSIGRRIRRATR